MKQDNTLMMSIILCVEIIVGDIIIGGVIIIFAELILNAVPSRQAQNSVQSTTL